MVCRHVTVIYKCKIKKNTTSSKIKKFHKPPIIDYIFPPGYWKKLLLPGYWGRLNDLSMLLLKWSKIVWSTRSRYFLGTIQQIALTFSITSSFFKVLSKAKDPDFKYIDILNSVTLIEFNLVDQFFKLVRIVVKTCLLLIFFLNITIKNFYLGLFNSHIFSEFLDCLWYNKTLIYWLFGH